MTVGRAGFWDHRGGTAFTTAATYSLVRSMLEAGEQTALGKIFQSASGKKAYARPCQIGTGRVEILLPEGWNLDTASLDLGHGEARITARDAQGNQGLIQVHQSRRLEAAWLLFEGVLPESTLARPVWEWEKSRLEQDGVPPPDRWGDGREGGFRQCLPEDPAVLLGWKWEENCLHIATTLSSRNLAEARESLWRKRPLLREDLPVSADWWTEFRRALPVVRLPDPEIQAVWDLHSYKLAGAHPPGAPAGSLQSAWMEDHRLPPWSNDYHFNINLQMMYGPCLGANLLGHFGPLWDMLEGWLPALRANGEAFFGAKGAMMLPHAVDDRCQVVGAFWSGTIDHACTAWMAQMAWLHYRHSLDPAILRRIAWPLLKGAFEGFRAMATESPDGTLSLPVSVSPEYHSHTGSGVKLWGRNASFQLSAFHMVAGLLPRAAEALGEPVDPRWEDVRKRLPRFAKVSGRTHRWGQQQEDLPRIALWEELDLEESHRHHSHLAGIFPFQTLDPSDPGLRPVIRESMAHWIALGSGNWAGWSFPWAAILCARCNLGDAAIAWLKWWQTVFTDPNGAPLHDADFPGCGALHAGSLLGPSAEFREVETMQLDAGCGAIHAILEILVQQREDRLHVLPALPSRWNNLSFDGVRVDGAFLIGATVTSGEITEVRVRSEKGGVLQLRIGETTHTRTMQSGESLALNHHQIVGPK